jgi:hypothetical protein
MAIGGKSKRAPGTIAWNAAIWLALGAPETRRPKPMNLDRALLRLARNRKAPGWKNIASGDGTTVKNASPATQQPIAEVLNNEREKMFRRWYLPRFPPPTESERSP